MVLQARHIRSSDRYQSFERQKSRGIIQGLFRAAGQQKQRLALQGGPTTVTAFEKQLDALITNERLIMLCSFSLQASGANEVLDAARAHQLIAARRNGAWEVIETAEL